ncbi:hypothetical protein HELRODRAFT_193169 [Helobdella robusta]|uniref:Uncharacterized protein n=1 Tax=Helobdella robusta TaxID=6412 RepID=T1FUP6_HELRO|nr:hypothetical protein HELRODRAFT_193169 [Helobdella robusta]ESN97641.1 hypothetical protein HELRODRAFT_193169 [Helobdella robusta]
MANPRSSYALPDELKDNNINNNINNNNNSNSNHNNNYDTGGYDNTENYNYATNYLYITAQNVNQSNPDPILDQADTNKTPYYLSLIQNDEAKPSATNSDDTRIKSCYSDLYFSNGSTDNPNNGNSSPSGDVIINDNRVYEEVSNDYRHLNRALPALPVSEIYDKPSRRIFCSSKNLKIGLPFLLLAVGIIAIVVGVYYGVVNKNLIGALYISRNQDMPTNFTKSLTNYMDNCVQNNSVYRDLNIRSSISTYTKGFQSAATTVYFFLTINNGETDLYRLYYWISTKCSSDSYGQIKCLDITTWELMNTADPRTLKCAEPTET